MSFRHYYAPALVVAAVTVWTLGCGERAPTEPGGAVLGKGKPPTQSTKVTIQNLVLQSSTLTIGGSTVDYTVDVVNDGKKREGVTLQGEIGQLGSNGVTSAVRGAGGIGVLCGLGTGVLPHGTCSLSFTATASNGTGGFGTLVAGPASLILSVLASDGSHLASVSVPITLVE